MSDAPHEHDDDGSCVPPSYPNTEGPNWRFSAWDIAAVATTTIGGLFFVVGQGLNLLAREFGAAANYSRQDQELAEARAEWEADQEAAAAELRRMVEGPGDES